jgi:hypothetical protein
MDSLFASKRPEQEIKILSAHTFLACVRNLSSPVTFRNMADTSLLVKCICGCTQSLNESVSNCMSDKYQKLYFLCTLSVLKISVYITFTGDSIHQLYWSVSYCFICIFLNCCLDCRHIFVRKLIRPWLEKRLLATLVMVMMTSNLDLHLC